jgi:hypothetical protein
VKPNVLLPYIPVYLVPSKLEQRSDQGVCEFDNDDRGKEYEDYDSCNVKTRSSPAFLESCHVGIILCIVLGIREEFYPADVKRGPRSQCLCVNHSGCMYVCVSISTSRGLFAKRD